MFIYILNNYSKSQKDAVEWVVLRWIWMSEEDPVI